MTRMNTGPRTALRRVLGVAAAIAMAVTIGAIGASAQAPKDKAPAKGAAPPPPPAGAAPATAPAGQQSAWVKLCEKGKFAKKDAAGKDVQEEKSICLTHHERLDGQSGMVLVSAALRSIDGTPKLHLMIMVPLGMAIPPGLHANVLTKDQWDKAAKKEQFDETQLKGFKIPFMLCHPAGCTAEIEATPELVGELKAGGGLMIKAANAAGQVIGFPIPLTGFQGALDGPPVDNKQYADARKSLFEQIYTAQKARYEEGMKKQQDEADKAKRAFGGTPPAAGGPAPAGAPKK